MEESPSFTKRTKASWARIKRVVTSSANDARRQSMRKIAEYECSGYNSYSLLVFS